VIPEGERLKLTSNSSFLTVKELFLIKKLFHDFTEIILPLDFHINLINHHENKITLLFIGSYVIDLLLGL